jgi:surface antigen
MKPAIDQVAPPHADTSYSVVSTLLATNTAYPFYECTYFVQTVTAGVCNVPISPSTIAWTDYPFACEFIDKSAAGFQWIVKGQGVVQLGDILLYTSSDNCRNDPGHIMIVVEVKDSNHFRVAEANELTVNGAANTGMETGVVSNTRIETLDDPYLAAGWFRRTGS